MTRNQLRVMGSMGAGALALVLGSCGEDGGIPGNPLVEKLAMECGIDVKCEAGGVLEGNASISGIASVDAFFQSVINFQSRADMVASGIDAELAAIGGAFGVKGDVAAGLKAKFDANLEGGIKLEAEPAKCAVDANVSVEAAARCEGEVMPGKVEVACEGSCEVDASASVMCEGDASLKCTTTAPSVACTGECKGSCQLSGTAAADCSGTCNGTCMGTCSAMNAMGQCAGSCDGMCMGSCNVELEAKAECEGKCTGECTVTKPSGGCEGGIRAECEAKAMGTVMCEGRCDGAVEPPSVKAECTASAKAEASMQVECSPPRIALHYELKAGLSATAQAEFEAGLRSLEARLPALLASMRKAEFVVNAGADLGASATTAIKGATDAFKGDANFRLQFGALCALKEAGTVTKVITDSGAQLTASAKAATAVTALLK